MESVERARVGKHFYPIYSHPLLRTKIKEEMCVQRHIARKLRDPRLRGIIDRIASRIVHEGNADNVSKDVKTTLSLINEPFAELNDFFDDIDKLNTVEELLSPHKPPVAVYEYKTSSKLRPFSPCSRSLQLRHPGHNLLTASMPPAVLSLLRRREQQQQLKQLQQQRRLRDEVHNKKNIAPTVESFSQQRDFLLKCTNEPATDVDNTSPFVETRHKSSLSQKKKEKKEQLQPPLSCLFSSNAVPDSLAAAGSRAYSMLPVLFEDSAEVQPHEMDLQSGAAQELLRLHGAKLRSLSPKAFGALDVTMDGNSLVFHRRQQAEPSAMQYTEAQQACKGVIIRNNALRRRVLTAISRPTTLSFDAQRFIDAGATSLGYDWKIQEEASSQKRERKTISFDLPEETYRGRVLSSVIKQPEADLEKL